MKLRIEIDLSKHPINGLLVAQILRRIASYWEFFNVAWMRPGDGIPLVNMDRKEIGEARIVE